MAFVYQHVRKDTCELFYIGIGKNKKRAYSLYNRNKHWHNIVNKHGYEIEILIDNISWELACEFETILINFYGRFDKKLGPLVNMTNGGDGSNGYITSNETKNLLSKINTGFKNPMWNKRKKDNPNWKIDAHNKRSVNQYTLNKKFIREYKTVTLV